MNPLNNIQIYTYLDYDNLKCNKNYSGLIIEPNSYSETDIESTIVTYLMDYEPLNLICVCAFINMTVQTKGYDALIPIQNDLLSNAGFIDGFSDKILFHRYNLLKLIELISKNLTKLKGTQAVLENYYRDAGKFCLALALLNKAHHQQGDFVRHLIRDHPLYYESNEYIKKIYYNRILKAYIIYCDNSNNEVWTTLVSEFESRNNISVSEYIRFVSKLWLYMNENFDPKLTNSFYFLKSKFPSYSKIVDVLSVKIKELFKDAARKDDGLYTSAPSCVNNPLLCIDDDSRCILDLKCLIDSNLALLHLISENSKNYSFKQIKDKFYSKVSEDVFVKILKNMLPDKICETRNKAGYPDLLINNDDVLILLEFTTAEPGYYTLYKDSIDEFKTKYSEILIKRKRQTKERKGKLYQIANHIIKLKKLNTYAEIYPILITDNYIGDFDLIDKLNNMLSNEIKNNEELSPLSKHKLTILSFDDIFTLWMCTSKENRFNEIMAKIAAIPGQLTRGLSMGLGEQR